MILALDQIITLCGRTKYGRERIQRHGQQWKIIIVRDGKIALESYSGNYLMWIDPEADPNYDVMEADSAGRP